MSLQDWGAIGELLGGVAIIVSLLYVGLQIKHGNRETRANTLQATLLLLWHGFRPSVIARKLT